MNEALESIYETLASHDPTMSQPPSMSQQHQIIISAMERIQSLFATKNEEYAAGADILGNFRRQAQQQTLPMSTAWMFLAGKHIDAIQQHIRDTREGKLRNRTQPIAERIDDLIVYALLLHVIVEEERL
jgi:hypothetical protein